MASVQEIKRYRTNLADELHSAVLYETLARIERNTDRKHVFAELAASERKHAGVWADKLKANGHKQAEATAATAPAQKKARRKSVG